MDALPKSEYNIAEVYGSQDLDERERNIIDFSEGKIQYLATKPEISGQGCNFQYHCHKAIFTGIGYEFNAFIQAIHRVHRFQQAHPVEIHIIYVESEEEVLKVLQRKWTQHNYLVAQMTRIISENGLSSVNVQQKLMRSLGLERREECGKLYTAINNDCTLEATTMPDNSVHLIHTSIPFSNHYEYTPSYNDFGHNAGNAAFFEQMDFLTPELLRILQPGRLAAIHVKDRILFGNATGTGMPTVDPFSDMTVFHFIKHGFQYMGRITIETDVVRENNQTYRLGYSEKCKDGSKMGVGCPEYLLLFRKLPTDTGKAYADVPVARSKKEYNRGNWQIDARAKWNSSGNRFLTEEELRHFDIDQVNRVFHEFYKTCVYDYSAHVSAAETLEKAGKLPATFETLKVPARTAWVWDDVNRMITLNNKQTRKNLMNHICPLQFDIVDRVIENWSNEGEVVFDPFGGIITVPYRAVMLGRKGIATELNTEYWRDGLSYLRAAELEVAAPVLFDLMKVA
jgi:DNA modification methylase